MAAKSDLAKHIEAENILHKLEIDLNKHKKESDDIIKRNRLKSLSNQEKRELGEIELMHKLADIRDELSDSTELLSVIAKNLIEIKYLLKRYDIDRK